VYWAMHRVQRLDVLLSGVLAGCVGITANCDVIYAWSAWYASNGVVVFRCRVRFVVIALT
jgi:ammonia channel protein AmtB